MNLKTRYKELYPHLKYFHSLRHLNNDAFVKELQKHGYSIDSVKEAIYSMQRLQKMVDQENRPPPGLKSQISLILRQTDPLLLWIQRMFNQKKQTEKNRAAQKLLEKKKAAFTNIINDVLQYRKLLSEATYKAGVGIKHVRGRENVNLNTHKKLTQNLKQLNTKINSYIHSINDPEVKKFIQEHPFITNHQRYYSHQLKKYENIVNSEIQWRYDTYFETEWHIREAFKEIHQKQIEKAIESLSRAEMLIKDIKPIDFTFIKKQARYTSTDIKQLRHEILSLKQLLKSFNRKNTLKVENMIIEQTQSIQEGSKNNTTVNQVRSYLNKSHLNTSSNNNTNRIGLPKLLPHGINTSTTFKIKAIAPNPVFDTTGITLFRPIQSNKNSSSSVIHTKFPLILLFLFVATAMKRILRRSKINKSVSQNASYSQSKNNNTSNTASSKFHMP